MMINYHPNYRNRYKNHYQIVPLRKQTFLSLHLVLKDKSPTLLYLELDISVHTPFHKVDSDCYLRLTCSNQLHSNIEQN
jgi:hypothetical protein